MGPEMKEMPNYSVYHNGEFIGEFAEGMELPELSIFEADIARGGENET